MQNLIREHKIVLWEMKEDTLRNITGLTSSMIEISIQPWGNGATRISVTSESEKAVAAAMNTLVNLDDDIRYVRRLQHIASALSRHDGQPDDQPF